MCRECVAAVQELFPSVPDAEYGDFLMSTTCYPCGGGADVRRQLERNKARMHTADYRECYGIAAEDLERSMARLERRDKYACRPARVRKARRR